METLAKIKMYILFCHLSIMVGPIWLIYNVDQYKQYLKYTPEKQKEIFVECMQKDWHQTLDALTYQRKLGIKYYNNISTTVIENLSEKYHRYLYLFEIPFFFEVGYLGICVLLEVFYFFILPFCCGFEHLNSSNENNSEIRVTLINTD